MSKLLVVAVTLALGAVALACGSGDTPSAAEPAVAARPTPTAEPTLAAESLPTALPAPTPRPSPAARGRDFVSFTDAMELFTVSHPADWELVQSIMVGVNEVARPDTPSGGTEVQSSPIGVVFFAGVPAQQGYSSNVSVVVESLHSGLAVAEYFESTQEFARGMFAGYEVRSRRDILVAGRDAIRTDLVFDIPSSAPESRKWRSIQTITVDGTRGWAISCGFAAPVSAEDLQTCDSIVRSFELLN